MDTIKNKCPHCGNVVVGYIDETLARKIVRDSIKKGGKKAIGLIAESVLPGSGAGVSLAAGILLEDHIAGISDDVESAIFSNVDFVFDCPQCGFHWKEQHSNQRDLSGVKRRAVNALMGASPVVGAVKAWLNNKQPNNEQQHTIYDAISVILQIVSEQLSVNIEEITPNSNLEDDLGADDLQKIEIIMELEKKFGVTIDKELEDITFVDDLIEIVTGQSLWMSEDFDQNYYSDKIEDDEEESRFYSFFNAYVEDEYLDMKVEELAGMFEREGNSCLNTVVKSQYFCVAAVVRLEYFLTEWIQNGFKNYQGYQQQLNLQQMCLVKGIEDIQQSLDILPNDKEYLMISGTIRVVMDFWVNSYDDKEQYIATYGNHIENCSGAENCLFNMEWLTRLFNLSYDKILNYCQAVSEHTSKYIESPDNSNEIEYLNELKEFLVDGKISDRERKLLEKIRIKLGISDSRAAEIEASLSNSTLSEEEQEYLNELKEILADGEVSPRDQRFLNKLKTINGISDARAQELESMIYLN